MRATLHSAAVAFQRFDGDGPGPEPLVRDAGPVEVRRAVRGAPVAVGTLACPVCDAPVLPARAMGPAEPLGCPVCEHAGAVREFLSLASPARATRVQVRVRRG